jgi:PAS domain S-box-containing protein
VNPAFEVVSGYSRDEVMGRNPQIWKSGQHDRLFYKELWDTISRGGVWKGQIVNKRKDGALFTEEATISPVRSADGEIVNFVAVKRDITQEIQLRKQLIQAQKLESIGTLAGGIAHDFNNLLQVVLGYSEMLLMDEDRNDRGSQELKAIRHAAKRGAELVRQILTFSRKTETNPRPLNLNQQVHEAQKLLNRTIPKMIEVDLRLPEGLKAVNADPGQIEQILLNLSVNARDAMPDGGRLTIATHNVTLDEEYCQAHLDVNPGEYVMLEVSDTGHGMKRDVVDHIFEPFYTTKGLGEGTGLGLAMVYGIVTGHGGHITCESEPGRGASFKIYLPAIPSEEPLDIDKSGIMPAFGSETILLVDDEELIRDLGQKILQRNGYTVLTASDGREALEIYSKNKEEIALVILDLIMPAMGGKECLVELLKINPQVKTLIASGFVVNGPTRETIDAGAKGYVSKPFNVRALLKAVRSTLDAASS